jgi:hypothetical protein
MTWREGFTATTGGKLRVKMTMKKVCSKRLFKCSCPIYWAMKLMNQTITKHEGGKNDKCSCGSLDPQGVAKASPLRPKLE